MLFFNNKNNKQTKKQAIKSYTQKFDEQCLDMLARYRRYALAHELVDGLADAGYCGQRGGAGRASRRSWRRGGGDRRR